MAIITSNSITIIDNTGVEKYLHIRYSNDGMTFTEDNGLTAGEWLGTCATNSSVAPTEFTEYQWSKIKGENGQAGIDAISFQIYSIDGYEFDDEIDNITLRTIAFCGDAPLEVDAATYQWYIYTPGMVDEESGDSIEWTEITIDTSETLLVSKYDFEKFPLSIKCKMIIGSSEYEAYVHLKNSIPNYTSRIGFLNGSNVFDSNDYLIAYMELYKNNQLVDGLSTTKYDYSDTNTILDNNIETNVNMDGVNIGDMCYFIYKTEVSEDTSIDNDENIEQMAVITREVYKVALGVCSAITEDENGTKIGTWEVANFNHKYTYINNIDSNSNLNVVVISRNDVNKTKDINFEAYYSNSVVSHAGTMVFDLKDPIVSDTEPSNPILGQLWLDTSQSPYVLQIYTQDNGWQYFEQQKGHRVFVADVPPADASIGDIWVLNGNYEVDGVIKYTEGSMLRAADIDGVLTWTDAMSDVTNTIANVKEVFSFNDGLTIAQQDIDTGLTPFFVHIDSKKMGFWDVEYNDDGSEISRTEVVHIGNKSAIIQNATLDGELGTTVQNDIKFNQSACFSNYDDSNNNNSDIFKSNFVWAVRPNGNYGLSWRGGNA